MGIPSQEGMTIMAEPTQVTVPGGKMGFNGRIKNSDLGTLDIRVMAILTQTKVNSRESSAAQAKTFYTHNVSGGSFQLELIHKNIEERNAFNKWMKNFMEKASRSQLSAGWVEVSVPVRRFVRKAVPQGTLMQGDAIDNVNRSYSTTMRFIGASDPAARREISYIKHSEDWNILKHYPGGTQVGWSAEEEFYDRGVTPVIRPGQPDRPV